MSQEIQEFIEKMKDWRENFPIEEYDYTKYDCEIANIAKMQKELNVEGLIDFWREKIKEKYFELKHPIYNEITLRAVYNYTENSFFNGIFMIDENNKYPCLILQYVSCINFFITDKFFIVAQRWETLERSLIQSFSIMRDVDISLLSFRDKQFGFSLERRRPMHFYIEVLIPLIKIGDIGDKKIYNKNLFFVPSKYYHLVTDSNELVYLFPNTTTMEMLSTIPERKLIVKDCIADIPTLNSKEIEVVFDLTLWLGLPGEKRAWLEQIEGSALILKNLISYFPKIKVYIDGMTAYDRQRQDFPENKILYDKVVKATKEALKDTLVLDVNELNGGGILKIHNL